MHSNSDDLTPQQHWLQERLSSALARFDDRTPLIYRKPIEIEQGATDWIGGWGATSLFLAGPIGVGKTHTAWQTCRRWLEAAYAPGGNWQGSPVIKTYRSTTLFDALIAEFDSGQRTLVDELQRADLVFIDDLAAAKPSAWTQERLYEIFDERYINRRPVIVTCDVLPNALSDVTGPRVASRLAEMCRGSVLLMDGDDRRKQVAA
ncbi:DnaA ATPase domain-containing protein [Streptomyces niveus]